MNPLQLEPAEPKRTWRVAKWILPALLTLVAVGALSWPVVNDKLDQAKVNAMIAANPDWAEAFSHNITTPLHLAAYKGDIVVAKILLAHKANANAQTFPGTPLHYAAHNGDTDMVKLLLAHKAKAGIRNSDGATPLDWAKNRAMAELLLTDDTDANARFHALCSAARYGRKDVVEFLLAQKVTVNAQNNGGWSPLTEAADGGYKEIVELLLANNAEYTFFDAAKVGDVERVKVFLEKDPDLVVSRDSRGRTALHYAAAADKKDMVELLLTNKADVSAKTKEGWTPLHLAVGHQEGAVVESLLAHKADINAKDNHGQTPMDVAKFDGSRSVVEALTKGAALNAPNNPSPTQLSLPR